MTVTPPVTSRVTPPVTVTVTRPVTDSAATLTLAAAPGLSLAPLSAATVTPPGSSRRPASAGDGRTAAAGGVPRSAGHPGAAHQDASRPHAAQRTGGPGAIRRGTSRDRAGLTAIGAPAPAAGGHGAATAERAPWRRPDTAAVTAPRTVQTPKAPVRGGPYALAHALVRACASTRMRDGRRHP